MKYNPDIHHRRSIRLREYDYSANGAYFVTICAHGRECLFGEISDGVMHLNAAGRMVEHVWSELTKRFPHITLDECVIMPNHFHGIIYIVGALLAAPAFESFETKFIIMGEAKIMGAASSAPTNVPTLGSIMRVFKSISAIDVNRLLDRQGCPVWQRNYYERVIRDDDELVATREYIENNPMEWPEDKENPES